MKGPGSQEAIYIGELQYIDAVVYDLVSLADAAQLLGVSSERVRQLVVAGDLPGVRFGKSWAVPRDAVAARRQVSNRRGRPLCERRAWQAIASGDVDLSNPSRFRNRGTVARYSMSAADAAYVISDLGAVESGIAAAIFHGQLLHAAGTGIDLYMSRRAHEAMSSRIAAVKDPLGSVVVRVVSDEIWPDVQRAATAKDGSHLIAPAGAAALDLMDSGDARHWVAAESLVSGDG